jgi:predicted regulator of Ras-like GTPase activity (Roadblock/LC7/MglB family)
MSKRLAVYCGCGLVAIVALGVSVGVDGMSPKAMDGIPPAAQVALEKLAGDHAISEFEQEHHNGTILFEAEWMVDGVEHDATVTEDGALVERSAEISVDEAPAAVRQAIAQWFGDDTTVEVERKTLVVYEVEARDGREMVILPTGQSTQSYGDVEDGEENDD